MWLGPGRGSDPKPRAEPALDRRQIVQAALGLLDDVGLDGLTMRGLAKRLGIQAASLYWHVRDKQDLLGQMAEEICASMREPDRTLPWQQQLEALAQEYRRVLKSHRDAARVLAASGGPSGPHRLRLTEIVLRTLLDAGLDPQDAAYAGRLLNAYVVMFVTEEAQAASAAAARGPGGASPEDHAWVAELPPSDFPSLVTLAPYLAAGDAEERFQFGIEILQSGLERRLAR